MVGSSSTISTERCPSTVIPGSSQAAMRWCAGSRTCSRPVHHRRGTIRRPMGELSQSIEQIREQFPGLVGGWASLDGAAGTQVPTAVIDAIVVALRDAMANVHGAF